MNALKRRRLNVNGAHATLERSAQASKPVHNLDTLDALKYVSSSAFKLQNTTTQDQVFSSLLTSVSSANVPIECNPVTAGLCTTTISRPTPYKRPQTGMPIITFASDNERSGALDVESALDNQRVWLLYDTSIETLPTFSTFQYHGITHDRQGIEMPSSTSNVDTIITQFNGSVAQNQSNECVMSNYACFPMYDLFNDECIFHKLHVKKEDTPPLTVGERYVTFVNTSINQGFFRKWILSPGNVCQIHEIFLSVTDLINACGTKEKIELEFFTFEIDAFILQISSGGAYKLQEWKTWSKKKSTQDDNVLIFKKKFTLTRKIRGKTEKKKVFITIHQSSRIGNRNDMAFLFKK
jgi:hypothetical protein